MSKYTAAREVLLKAKFPGNTAFLTIAGVTTRTLRFADRSIDVTNQDSDGEWRELVQDIGTDSLDFDGDGKFVSSAVMVQLLQARRSSGIIDYQVVIPGLGTFEGPFVIGLLEFTGVHGQELQFRGQWRSAGVIAFFPNTAAA